METLIYERGKVTLPGLSKIDDLFLELQQSNSQKQRRVITRLESEMSKIFGTEIIMELHTYGEFSNNFAILPILKSKQNAQDNEVTSMKIKLNNIDAAYMFLGSEILEYSTPYELTAILLHEIGHLTEHTTRIQKLLLERLFKIKYIADVWSKIPILNTIFTPLLILTTRTLSFTNHAHEYNADRFAVKYGYGDELANWCSKHLKMQKKEPQKLSVLMRITKFIDSWFDDSDHPKFEKRIVAIVNDMETKYRKQYSSKQIKVILDKHYKI